MIAAKPFIERDIHPTIIVGAYYKALEESLKIINELAVDIDVNNDDEVMEALESCVGTKFASRWGKLTANLSI